MWNDGMYDKSIPGSTLLDKVMTVFVSNHFSVTHRNMIFFAIMSYVISAIQFLSNGIVRMF